MPIYVALLKHGYQNFSFTSTLSMNSVTLIKITPTAWEKLEVYSPEYNILKTHGSPIRESGWKHSEATIESIRLLAKKRMESPEFLTKLSEAQSSSIGVEVI